jgi:hypothetical protein
VNKALSKEVLQPEAKRPKHLHVDDWVTYHSDPKSPEAYAKFFFVLSRLPAGMAGVFHEHTKQFQLYCTYNGKRYRVTGASRLGDIWLSEDLSREVGYNLRVYANEVTDWGPAP